MKRKRKNKRKRPVFLILMLTLVAMLLSLVLASLLFMYSKLSKLDYRSGTLTEEEQQAVAAEVEQEMASDAWLEENIDISGLELIEYEPVLPVKSEPKEKEKPGRESEKKDEILNVLLLGTDERVDWFASARADSIMLLSLNLTDYSAKLVSIERGMGVPILEGEFKGQWDWITHAFRYGGADLMLKEVQTCLNVDVEHYVRVNFAAFTKVIDILGGVDIELTGNEANYINSFNLPGHVSQGWNHLNGEKALVYARTRHIDSDWVRITRQRNVIQQCVYALKGSDLNTINRLADEILPLIQTNFTTNEIMKLLVKVPGFVGVTFDQMTIPVDNSYGGRTGMGGRGMFAADFELNSKILHDFIYGKEETVK